MDLQTTLKLLDAGYTKEEINQMSTPTSVISPEPAAHPEPSPAPETAPAPTAPAPTAPEPQRVDPDTNKIIADLTKQVSDLAGVVKAIQDKNVKAAQQNAPVKETAQTVLESFFGKPN
jgi:hypothetical protein